jgi:hypothetical protein
MVHLFIRCYIMYVHLSDPDYCTYIDMSTVQCGGSELF